MRTANEIVNYINRNEFTSSAAITKTYSIKSAQLIIDNLMHGEQIKVAWLGLANYKSMSKHSGNYVYVLTNKRIIYAQKRVIGGHVKSIMKEQIEDVQSSTGVVFGIIAFVMKSGNIHNAEMDKKAINRLYNKIMIELYNEE